MINIIPNFHPIFVHFTVALITVALLTAVASFFAGEDNKQKLTSFARLNLYLGALFTLATVASGIYAFGTVDHDTPSHTAMIDHRNWALPTTAIIILGAIMVYVKRKKPINGLLPAVLAVLFSLVSVTAYKGGELVYRYGLGVMSLPQVSGEGDNHQHSPGEGHGEGDASDTPATETHEHSEGGDHDHQHEAEEGHEH